MNYVLQDNVKILASVACSLDSHHVPTSQIVAELLSCICFVEPPKGQNKVLSSLSHLQKIRSKNLVNQDDDIPLFNSWLKQLGTWVDLFVKSRNSSSIRSGYDGELGSDALSAKDLSDCLVFVNL